MKMVFSEGRLLSSNLSKYEKASLKNVLMMS